MTRALAFFRRAKDDARGVSAVEFAMVAPILLLFYFASVEISLMLTVDRKITNTASAVGDLVAQDDVVDAGEINDIFNAARAIMEPYDSSGVQMRVSSIVMTLDGDVEVTWSQGRGMPPLSCGGGVSVPDGLLSPGQSVIMSEARLEYASPISEFLVDTFVLEDAFYLRPRRTLEVDFNPTQC